MGNFAVWLERRIAVHRLVQEAATQRALQSTATQMTNEMKANHPWTNRTGDAEKSVGAVVDEPKRVGPITTYVLRAGYVLPPRVHYGWALELAHAGQYAITKPTVSRYTRRISSAVVQARRVR